MDTKTEAANCNVSQIHAGGLYSETSNANAQIQFTDVTHRCATGRKNASSSLGVAFKRRYILNAHVLMEMKKNASNSTVFGTHQQDQERQ